MNSVLQDIDWKTLIPPEQWAVYKCVLAQVEDHGLPFALGGGLAVSAYTGQLRNTKDLDIYIMPEHRDRLVSIMSDCGLTDYFETRSYDRGWIYRGNRGEIIVDAIWAMANRRAQVDESWVSRGPVVTIYDKELRVIPPEELIWSKLYIMQRDRCDWPDILNLIYATGPNLDWNHLLDRVKEDLPLLKGVLAIFAWVSPQRALSIPRRIWDAVELPLPKMESDPEGRPARPDLLDTRPWFNNHQDLQPAA